MEFVVGPLIALFASLGYSANEVLKQRKENSVLVAKVESLEARLDAADTQTLQKVMTTMMPLAKAVNKLNNTIGIE